MISQSDGPPSWLRREDYRIGGEAVWQTVRRSLGMWKDGSALWLVEGFSFRWRRGSGARK